MKVAQSGLTYCKPNGLYSPWNSLGQKPRVGSLSFLQRIVPTQRLNPGIPDCRQILYQLSHLSKYDRNSETIKETVDRFNYIIELCTIIESAKKLKSQSQRCKSLATYEIKGQ